MPDDRKMFPALAAAARLPVRVLVATIAVVIAACGAKAPVSAPAPIPNVVASYVGTAACVACHSGEAEAWRESHHAKAMQPATAETVLGDFRDATFRYEGVTSRFSTRDGRYYVTTDGADGKPTEFEIRYTFGVWPLQQYLIPLPDGRLQALSIAWDSRPRASGGQRWYHLYGDQHVTAASPLHWTRPSQNWNSMCAECHSTNLHRGYDATANRYDTTWTDLSVGCEACHGPGSLHVRAAAAGGLPAGRTPGSGLIVRFDPKGTWIPDPLTGAARRSTPRTSAAELETCATCHSRRAQFAEDHLPGRPLTDTHLPALLRAGLYQADGQMQDEVYNYGSFLQSKMHANGVSCGDCHEPHGLKLRAEGNAVCTQCHSARYDAPAHHQHPAGSAGAACANCHMPVRTYMGVHRRHDHGFRVPRPDLDGALGTSDACTDCHHGKSPTWAAQAIEKWFPKGREGFQTFGPALHAARSQALNAPALLAAVASAPAQPAIARATALAELAPFITPTLYQTIVAGLADPDPLVRIGAVAGLDYLPGERRWTAAAALLDDPSPAVRLVAVPFLLTAPADEAHRSAFDRALEEYLTLQRANADRAPSRANLGLVAARRGDVEGAEREYRAALALDAFYTPARINLADLLRTAGRESEAETLLREGLKADRADAALHHALGLSLVRAHRLPEAIVHLQRASELAPGSARYAYVHAIALDSSGQRPAAIARLRATATAHPADRDTLLALVDLLREAGNRPAALRYAENLAVLLPGDPTVAALVDSLREGP
jgi:tetratricopeptide (TPR) repeat protein